MLVFVYGSLKSGEQYHFILGDSARLGPWTTPPAWHFWDLDGYPAMSPGGAVAVVGEVYRVDGRTLAALDRLEEVPTLYQRATLATPWGEAFCYIVERPPADRVALPDGAWVPAHRRRPG